MKHLAFAVLLSACGDDYSLEVRVEHPGVAQIERTVVAIYEAPGDGVRCADIEFQDISEAELAGLEVSSIEQGPDGVKGQLDGISRVGTKLVVARGFRANGMYFTAGCTEHGTIEGDEVVVVNTVVVAAVSLGGVESSGMDANTIPITVTTPLGTALPKRPVGWRVYGYAGATPMIGTALTVGTDEWEPMTTTCTGQDGAIRLRPVPPANIGGYAARVRVSWGQEPPRLFTAFTRAEAVPKPLAPLASLGSAAKLCTSRRASTTSRVVCVEDNGSGEPIARDLAATVGNGFAPLAVAASQTFAPGDPIASVYNVSSGSTRDAYAITRTGKVIGLFNPSMPPNAQQASFAGELVAEAISIPTCKPGDAPRLAVRTVGGPRQKLYTMHALGGPPMPLGNVEGTLTDVLRFNSGGCVTELSTESSPPTSRQVVVVDSVVTAGTETETTSTAYYDCSAAAGRCATRLPLPFNGVGFRRGNNGEEDRLVVPLFDATGTVVSELIFLDAKLVERERISSASVPDHIVSGNFDGDATADLAWDFTALGATQSNFQIAYAREVDGDRLTAMTGAKMIVVSEMFAADVTGDGFDDIVLVQRSRDPMTAPHGVGVIPLGAAAAPIAIRTDDTCP